MSELQYQLPDGRIPVVVSADSADDLGRFASAVARYVREHAHLDVHRVAAYLLDARPVRRHRAVVAATGREDLLAGLDAIAADRAHPDVVRGTASSHRFAYVYPGQGSQRPGMGAVDYAQSAAYRAAVDECHAESLALFGSSPLDYVLGRGDATETDDVTVVQPALFMHMLGLTAMWDAAGVRPAMTVGHSQGEIAAAVRSGVATLGEGLVVVTERARAVEQIAPRGYTMAVLGIDLDEAERLLARDSGWMELSVVNSAHILCVSGERGAVLGLIATLEAAGKFAKEIRVAYPAHTSIVSKFSDTLVTAFDAHGMREHFAEPQIPCIGATLGEPVDQTTPVRDYWFWNLRNRVRFDRAVARAARDGADTFIEIAEHPTLVLALSETLAEHDGTTILGTRRRECVDHALFTRNVLTVAVSDTAFDWSSWAVPERTRSLPLEGFPNSAMRRTRLWARHDAGADDPVNRPDWAPPRTDHDVRVLRTAWERPARRGLLAPQRIAILTPTGADTALAAAVCAAAPDHGAVAWQVPAGGADIGPMDAALLLLPASGGEVDADIAAMLADSGWRGGLVDLPPTFWIVTTGAETVAVGDVADPAHAALAAGLRCLSIEETGVRIAQLDLPAAGAAADEVLSAVHVAGESALAIRDGAVHVKRLVPATPPAAAAAAPDLRHVLITGGTGQVGLVMAERFARDGARRITLLSRSGGGETARRTSTRIAHRYGVDVDIRRGDLTDDASVSAVASGLPPVTVLVHAALDYVDRPLDQISAADVRRSFDAKVHGLRRLLTALGSVGRVLICSSLAATLGGRGQALYAASNRLLEVAAAQLRADGVDAVAIGWGLWAVQGPLDADGLARVTATGVVPMAPSAALDAGLAVHGFDARVLAASWPELRALLELTGSASLIAEVPDGAVVQHPEPVAAIAEAEDAAVPIPTPAVEDAGAGDPGASDPASSGPGSGDLAGDLAAELAVTMGLGVADIDPAAPLVALGMDSLQALDFRKRVQSSLACDLPVEAILGGASLAEVVDLMGQARLAS